MTKPIHVYQAYIAADVKEVWKAITDGDYTVRYFYGTRVESDWTEGAAIRYLGADGSVVADGVVLAIDPPNRLEYTFTPHWDPELEAEGGAREVWLVEDANGASKLTVEMYDVAADSKTYRDFTVRYFYGTRVESDWTEGAAIRYLGADGSVVADGVVLAIDPPNRLEYTFTPHWDPELEAEGGAREVWLVEDANGASKLTVEMYDVAADSKTYRDFTSGFPYIVSGLMSVLETGESLPAPY